MFLQPKFRVLLVFRRRCAETETMLRGIARYQRLHGQWSVFVDDDTVLETEGASRYSPEWCSHQLSQISHWLKQQPLPLALLVCHDHRGVQVMDAVKQCGLSVPEDVLVLGVNDDLACCEMAQPQLSSIALDSSMAGFLAAECLATLMKGEPVPRVRN